MADFVVTYRYVAAPEKLAQLRAERFAYFERLEGEGHLLASGQLLDGELADGLLVLRAPDASVARQLLDRDPFAQAGLVAERTLAAWRPTAGAWVRAR